MLSEKEHHEETIAWSDWIKNNSDKLFHESPTLYRAWIKRLKEEVTNILLQRKIRLRAPAIRIDSAIKRWGLWNNTERTIYISRWLMLTSNWDSIIETLKHELAHMLSIELFCGLHEPPHGKSFKKSCKLLGVTSRASASNADIGLPLDSKNHFNPNSQIIDKIRKLLKLSESSNKHEAEQALLKANQLLLKHNMERSDLNEHQQINYHYIGKMRKRFPMEEIMTLNILSEYFLVDYLIVPVYQPIQDKSLYAAEIYGTKENIQFADYVYDFIGRSADQEWNKYRKKHALKGISYKKSFMSGYLTGFKNTLNNNSREKSYALLVKNSSLEIRKYIRNRYPRIKTTSRRSSTSSSTAYKDGHLKGRNLKIKNPVNALKRLFLTGS